MAEYVKVSDLNTEYIASWIYRDSRAPSPYEAIKAGVVEQLLEGVPTVELREERAIRHGGVPWRSRRLVGPWGKVDDES